MLIKTEIDITRGLATLDLILKKIPYATNNALTRTAKELVQVERDELKTEFQVRKQFILNRVKIVKYSRPNDLWTRVAIDRDVQGGALLLTEFEDGGAKTPDHGSELAVGLTRSAVRPTFAQSETPSLLYKALKITPHTTSGGIVQFKGARRTFVIAGIGVFQRTTSRQRGTRAKKGVAAGNGRDEDIVLLYRFEPSVPLHKQMHFITTAREFVHRRFGVIWREEFVREMAGRAK
jgi:hypothetical protein